MWRVFSFSLSFFPFRCSSRETRKKTDSFFLSFSLSFSSLFLASFSSLFLALFLLSLSLFFLLSLSLFFLLSNSRFFLLSLSRSLFSLSLSLSQPQKHNRITFFFKVPRVYAIALPGVGFLLPPRSHALSTLACVVLILGSVKTAAADREAFLGREMHEIVAGVLSSLTTALLGSLSPVVENSGSGVVAGAAAAAAGGLSSPPPPALPPLAASLLSSSTSLITGRRATVAFLAANQVMSCHWVSVIHAALVRRERRRFELMKRAEEEMTETEGEEDGGDDDDNDDDDDNFGANGAEKRATSLLARRRRALSSAKTRLYLGRTAEIDWLIGQATLHAAGWVAIWTAAEAWHRWKSGRLWKG